MSTSATDLLNSIGLNRPQAADGPRSRNAEDLGVNDFLALMLAQIRNQDPFEPQTNGEFIAQIAQFGTVSGIDDLKDSFSSFSASMQSNQALQSAALLGRNVQVRGDRVNYRAGATASVSVEVPYYSGQTRVQVLDGAGSLVRTIDLGGRQPGTARVVWDGLRDDGTYAAPGEYRIKADALIDGQSQALNTYVERRVVSVALSRDGGIEVEFENGERLPVGMVRQIS